MKKRRKFILSIVADALFLIGAAAIVFGIAIAGHVPLAVGVGGGEMIGAGWLIAAGLPESGKRGDC